MKTTIGRIVIFNVPESLKPTVNFAEKLPAMIVRVWSDTCVNLKVITDGKEDLWYTSCVEGNQELGWNWPIKEE
jgi:hypothetical protein